MRGHLCPNCPTRRRRRLSASSSPATDTAPLYFCPPTTSTPFRTRSPCYPIRRCYLPIGRARTPSRPATTSTPINLLTQCVRQGACPSDPAVQVAHRPPSCQSVG